MDNLQEEYRIKRYFQISALIKGAISLAEILSGLILLIVPVAFITGWIVAASQDELVEEPGDFIATHSLQLAQHFSVASGTIIGIYLLIRGSIKLGLVAALLKNQYWAYPVSLAVLALFIIYQSYEIIVGHSLLIVAITAFDLIFVYFIWREYGILKAHLRAGGTL